MVTIVAHRGWSGEAPENTMTAFRLAMSEPDIAFIELDVHLSKDGVPVVIHDHTVDRTTDGSGRISDHTLEELRGLDAGGWFAERFAGEVIPTLEEVLLLAKDRIGLHVELKTMGGCYPGIEEEVLRCLERCGMKEQVVLSSFDHDSMKRVHELDPSVRTALIYLGKPVLLLEQLRYAGAGGASLHYAFVTRELVEEMAEEGIDLGVWTVDDSEALEDLIGKYPDLRITTNFPDRVLRIVRGAEARV